MSNILYREFMYIWYYIEIQFEQIFKYWALGIVTGSFVSVFLKNKIHKIMTSFNGKKLGIIGVIPAATLGIISPFCMYGTIPIVAAFSKDGDREDWIAAFMMSSVLLNPQLFFYSFALGSQLALIRLLVCFIAGIIAGILVRIFFKKKSFYQFNEFDMPANRDTDPSPIIRLLKNIWRNVKITFPYFLLGIIITALYQRYIPSEWIVNLFGANHGFGTLMAAALGVPLYMCGGGTIPIIYSWLASGMSVGSAVAFMIAGPATKITNLGALKMVLGSKTFVIYIAYSMLFSILAGIFVNMLF